VISPLLERAARRASQADAVLKTDETTTLEFVGGELVRGTVSTSQGTNLRVIVEGRPGIAGSVEDDPEELLQRAMASASLGEPTVLSLPFQTTLAAVVTHMPRASAATTPDLATYCHLAHDRLAAERAELRMILERSIGSVRVANTRGVDASYDVSLVSLRVEACRVRDGRRIAIEARLCGADVPSLTELEHRAGSGSCSSPRRFRCFCCRWNRRWPALWPWGAAPRWLAGGGRGPTARWSLSPMTRWWTGGPDPGRSMTKGCRAGC
jgi:predicted Zn-dependent protease